MSSSSGRSRRFSLVAVLTALLVAGVLSGFASTSPDGLESVAESVGLLEQEQEHPVAGSPLSGYQVSGVEDERLSTGVAGVVGVVLVLALAGGLAAVLSRRRNPQPADAATGPTAPSHGG